MSAVTVLIPARNSEKTIKDTLNSLKDQTFSDFEVLLVNDASTDRTVDIAKEFASRLNLRIISLETNAGVAGALNRGLADISSPLIARLDADDMAFPTRLERQVAFMEQRPEVDVCGTWMEMFYEEPDKEVRILVKPLEDAQIKTALIQYTALSHPSVMLRKSFIDDVGLYDVRSDFAEDYELWCRGALLGKRYANMGEVLTRYRQHGNQVGQQKVQLQYDRDMTTKRKYLSALLGGEASGNLAEFFSKRTQFVSRETALMVIQQSLPLLFKLSRKVWDEKTFNDIVSECLGRHLAAT